MVCSLLLDGYSAQIEFLYGNKKKHWYSDLLFDGIE